MERYYHKELSNWGPNLSLVFSGDKDMALIEPDEWEIIVNAIRRCKLGKGGMIDTSGWGSVSFIKSLDHVIEFLANCVDKDGKCVFGEFKLPEYDRSKGITGFDTEKGLIGWEDLWINYKAQRTINVVNLIRHLFNFKSALVFGATGRKDSKGRVFINDGQHGSLLLGLVGADRVPVRYVESDEDYVDFDQFLALNVDNYETEDYDKHRNQVSRATKMKEARQELYVADKLDYELDRVVSELGVTFVPKAKTNIGSGETAHVSKYQALYTEFKKSTLGRALRILRMSWPAHGAPQEPVWGLCELIRSQDKKTDREWESWEHTMALTLKTKWPTGPDGVWKEVNAVIQKQMPKSKPEWRDDFRIQTGNRGKMIGTAFREIYYAWDEARQQAPGAPRSYGITVDPIYRGAVDKIEYPEGFPIGNMVGYKSSEVA